jgi:hypothetical protein
MSLAYNNIQHMQAELKSLLLILMLLASSTPLDWQASGNMTQEYMDVIWGNINTNFPFSMSNP